MALKFRSKFLLTLILVGVIASATTWYTAQSFLTPRPLEKVTYSASWVLAGNHAYFFAAKDLGFYEKAGLSVNVVRGFGSSSTVKKVDSGTVPVGDADMGTLAILRSQGAKVRTIAMLYHNAGYTLLYLKGRGINTPKDIEGKAWGTVQGSSTWVLFPIFAQNAGIDKDKVRVLFIDAATLIPGLISGKLDVIDEYIFTKPAIDAAAQKQREEVGIFRYTDYGLDIYSNGIVASEETIQKNPDLLRRFVKSTYEGLKWAMENPNQATEILLKYHPELDKEISLKELQVLFTDVLPKDANRLSALQLARMDPAKVERTAEIIDKYFNVKPPVKGEDLFTNQFAEER